MVASCMVSAVEPALYSLTSILTPRSLEHTSRTLTQRTQPTQRNAGLMLRQRLRRWPNINPALVQHVKRVWDTCVLRVRRH